MTDEERTVVLITLGSVMGAGWIPFYTDYPEEGGTGRRHGKLESILKEIDGIEDCRVYFKHPELRGWPWMRFITGNGRDIFSDGSDTQGFVEMGTRCGMLLDQLL